MVQNVCRKCFEVTFSIIYPEKTKVAKLLALASDGPLRARDLALYGIPRSYLQRLCRAGVIEKVSRGLYRIVDAPVTQFHSLVEVTKCIPNGIVCLLSALQFHEMTTELPYQVWIMIERQSRMPKLAYPATKIIRASGDSFCYGVEKQVIEGASVQITSPAKTVADCFRFRRHVGMDVSMAALGEYFKKFRGGVDELTEAAKADRIFTFMRPYMEALA